MRGRHMRSVLFVDDEAHVTRVAKLTLERSGYEVVIAANGVEGLAALRERSFDVVITDIQMPRMGGREFCEQVRAELPERKHALFVVTARAELEVRDWIEDFPDCQFLRKPLSLRLLVSRLAALFGDAD